VANQQPVLCHSDKTTGSKPRCAITSSNACGPIVEDALKRNGRARWPFIIFHPDFKDRREPLLRAVWNLLR
jgi:hypothetical protein